MSSSSVAHCGDTSCKCVMLSVTSKALFTIRWWFTCHSVGVSVACVSWPCIWIRGARSPSADARPRSTRSRRSEPMIRSNCVLLSRRDQALTYNIRRHACNNLVDSQTRATVRSDHAMRATRARPGTPKWLQHKRYHTRTVCNLATWQCTIRGNLDNTLSWALLWSPHTRPWGEGGGWRGHNDQLRRAAHIRSPIA